MGNVSLLAVTPNRQSSILLTHRLFAVRESKAFLAGQDMGHPVRANKNPGYRQFQPASEAGFRQKPGLFPDIGFCRLRKAASRIEQRPFITQRFADDAGSAIVAVFEDSRRNLIQIDRVL